jgi:hypothetical protein
MLAFLVLLDMEMHLMFLLKAKTRTPVVIKRTGR